MSDGAPTITGSDEVLEQTDCDLLVKWLERSGDVTSVSGRKAFLYDLGIGPSVFSVDEASTDHVFSVNLVNHLSQVGDNEAICKLVKKLAIVSVQADRDMEPLKTKLGIPSLGGAVDPELEPMAAYLIKIQDGLDALYDLERSHVPVKDAVRRQGPLLKRMCAQIRDQHCYKSLHDKYEGLRAQFLAVDECLHGLKEDPNNEQAWNELYDLVRADGATFQITVTELLETARVGMAKEYDDLMMNELESVRENMVNAIEKRRTHPGFETDVLASLDLAQNDFAHLLNTVPRDLNNRLVEGAKTLPLETLVETLKRIGDEWDSSTCNQTKVCMFEESIDALKAVCDYSSDLIQRHNYLQMIDSALKRFEMNKNWDEVDLQIAWPRLSKFAKPVYEHRTDKGAVELGKVARSLDQAFGPRIENSSQIRLLFEAYRSQTVVIFKDVDTSLLSLCRRMTEGPLVQLEKIVRRVT